MKKVTLILLSLFSVFACSDQTVNTEVKLSQVELKESLYTPVEGSGISVEGDKSFAIVGGMAFVVKHMDELALTQEQKDVLMKFRQEEAPRRMVLEKNIVALRGNLRQAILSGEPQEKRDELIEQIILSELAHIQIRNRCVDLLRKTLTTGQFDKVKNLYLESIKE